MIRCTYAEKVALQATIATLQSVQQVLFSLYDVLAEGDARDKILNALSETNGLLKQAIDQLNNRYVELCTRKSDYVYL